MDILTKIIFVLTIFLILFIMIYDDRLKLDKYLRTGSNNPLYYYIEPNVTYPTFRDETHNIIQNSGWNKMYNLQLSEDSKKSLIFINLVPTETLSSYKDENDNNFDIDGRKLNYSITSQSRFSHPLILIDSDNWKFGVKRSSLTLDQYKEYVITHEFGHALGFDHQKCDQNSLDKEGRCPVMNQSTRGCKEFLCGFRVNLDIDLKNRIKESFFK